MMMRNVLAFLTLLTLSVTLPVLAHDHGDGSWINQQALKDPISGEWCCNSNDCKTVPAGGVREIGGGYQITETSETIPYRRIIWRSPDGLWWRCRNLSTNATRCLIGPPPNS